MRKYLPLCCRRPLFLLRAADVPTKFEVTMSETIEKRIQILEDIEAIKKLKATYRYLADAGIAGEPAKYDELVNHFVDDVSLEFVGFGVYRGKEAAKLFFRETVHQLWSYAAHMVVNPIIHVDEGGAAGTWLVHVACTSRKSNRAVWVQGKYEEKFLKIKDTWKWKSIKFYPDFYTPFDKGWAKLKMMPTDQF
jgi:hypothetical protein